MGNSISWIAVRGMPVEAIHEHLGIRASGDGEDLPESSCTAATLPNGWHVVFYNEGCDAVDRYAKSLIETGAEAVACYVEEHVMASGASAWRDGRTIWMAEHNPARGLFDLRSAGEVPEQFQEIADRLQAEQEEHGGEESEVDYIFDAPIDLAKSIVEFRHNEDLDTDDETPWMICEILNPAPGPAHMAGAGKFGCFGVIAAGVVMGGLLCAL